MGEVTKIEWCDHTFNPWIGCTKVSPGCAHCYAERDNRRFNWVSGWGPGAPRRITSDATWKNLRKWDEKAAFDGKRRRVFVASLADVFDSEAPLAAQRRLWDEIEACPHLEFLLLTKRPQNWAGILPGSWLRHWPDHVRLGFTAEDQRRWDERCGAALDFRWHWSCTPFFVSCEPLIGPVNLQRIPLSYGNRFTGHACELDPLSIMFDGKPLIGWVIAGGETGGGSHPSTTQARPMCPSWPRSLRDQCAANGIPFFFKQWGEWAPSTAKPIPGKHTGGGLFLLPDGRNGNQGDWWAGRAEAVDLVGKAAAGALLDGRAHKEFPRFA